MKLRHFNKARDLYDATTPIRGNSQDIRPLKKREHDRRIVKINDNTYAYRLYSTHVVTCLSDGTIELNMGYWDTPTTREFIDKYTPLRVSRMDGITYINGVYVDGEYVSWLPIPSETIFLQMDDKGPMHLKGTIKCYKSAVNRERSKKVRELIKPFLDYCETILAITDYVVDAEEIDKNAAWNMVWDEIGNEDIFYSFMLWAVRSYGEWASPFKSVVDIKQLRNSIRNAAYNAFRVYDNVECDYSTRSIVKVIYTGETK